MTHKEKALDYFSKGFHCSQSVLAAFAPECGLTEEQAFKLGACLGTGMRKGAVCGSCTGALMVLGLLYGFTDATNREARAKANTVNDKLMDRFAEISGSCICNDLLQCDIRTAEGIAYARSHFLFTGFCPKMVANAVDVLEQIIRETGAAEA